MTALVERGMPTVDETYLPRPGDRVSVSITGVVDGVDRRDGWVCLITGLAEQPRVIVGPHWTVRALEPQWRLGHVVTAECGCTFVHGGHRDAPEWLCVESDCLSQRHCITTWYARSTLPGHLQVVDPAAVDGE